MLLLALAPAHAATLSVPIRATFAEYTGWGEDPVLVDDVISATVAVSNPATKASFSTKGELLLKEKSGAGQGELAFDADPSGTVRTWALYALDAHGVPLSKSPEIVDVLFGQDGDGTIVARESSCCIRVRNVKIKKRGIWPYAGQDPSGTHDVVVEVADTNAAYVGIQELASDGTPLAEHADLETMTAEVYAAYQGLALDGIVPLDTWKATVDGTVSVDGLATDGTTVEGAADLTLAVSYYRKKLTKEADARIGTVSYGTPIELKKKGAAHMVMLKNDDALFDVYDASFDVIVSGDARGWDVGAILLPTTGAPKPITPTALTLDPSDIAIGATATFKAVFPAKPEAEDVRTLGLQPLDAFGKPMDSWLECTLTPTALSVTESATTLNYVGECLRDDEGRAIVRGLRMALDSAGTGTISAELLGLQWQKAGKLAFDVDGDDLGIGLVTGSAAVTETTFPFAFGFATDAHGETYNLELSFWGAATAPDLAIVGTGIYRWPHYRWETGPINGGIYAHNTPPPPPPPSPEAGAIQKGLVRSGSTVEIK